MRRDSPGEVSGPDFLTLECNVGQGEQQHGRGNQPGQMRPDQKDAFAERQGRAEDCPLQLRIKDRTECPILWPAPGSEPTAVTCWCGDMPGKWWNDPMQR